MEFIQTSSKKRLPSSSFSSPSTSSSPSQTNDVGTSFKVAVRVRPLIERERKEDAQQCIHVELEHKAVVIAKPEPRRKQSSQYDINSFSDIVRTETPQSQNFFFDLVFGPSATQQNIYETCVRHIVMSVLEGYNGSIIAYGQTGTGKSYTIEGGDQDATRGVIPRASEEIFTYIKTKASIKDRFLVRVSFLEIYNERLTDLLDPSHENLRIREDGAGSVYVEGLEEHVVRSTEEINKLIRDGAALRKTASTKMNVESSRSHAVFTIILEHAVYSGGGSIVTIGKLRLVDLAGSEKIDSDAKVQQQTETKNINVSLHTFSKVIMSLTSGSGSQHIPYRDSKLTRILQDSLGGNCKTSLITTITPVASCYTESLSSLNFAKRAKRVKNTAIINKDVSQKALLSAYQDEIRKLREQLQKQGPSVDEEQLEELEKNMKVAQMEKAEVISELERQRKLYSKAEEEKQLFMKRIEDLEHMLLQGGSRVSETEDLKKVIKEEREKILTEAEVEYKEKLAQLEEEKKRLADEREEIERQKEYFAKRRIDFKPDGSHDKASEEGDRSQQLFKKPSLPKPSLASRPPPPGASMPLPFTTHTPFNVPLPRRLSQPAMRPRITPQIQSWAVHPASIGTVSSLYNQHVTEQEAYQQYAMALSHPETGIACQELQSGVRVFNGTDAVQWFGINMEGINTFEEARAVGQRLIEIGLISEIQGGDQFIISDKAFYQFTDVPYSVTPFNSRPSSAMSMMSIRSGFPMMPHQRTGSLPVVHTPMLWEHSSTPQLFSPSLTTLNNGSSPQELLEQYHLSHLNPSVLHLAAITGDRVRVKEIVQTMSVDTPDCNGNTPLMYAVIAGQTKCCTLLLKHLEANVEAVNGAGQTALMLAITNEHNDTAKILLKHGAQNSKVDNKGETVFHMAARNMDTRSLEVLFKYSSDLRALNERNTSFQTPLHVAVLANKPHNITALLKAKADIGASDTEGRTSLHYAVQHQSLQCLQTIINNTPNEIDLVDINGCSALHLACQESKLTVVKTLLASQRCDVNLADDVGCTPLHYAVLSNSPDIVTILLSNGVDTRIRDKRRMTPLQYSREKNLKECTAALLLKQN